MADKPTSRTSVLRILGVLLPLLLIGMLVLRQSNFLVGRALLIAFGDTESVYRSAWFEWDGDVVARDLVVYPYDIVDEELAIRAERVHVATPGWFWFIRNTFDRKRLLAKLDRVQLTLEGVRSAAGIDPTLGDLGPIGAASASPFEAEGCAEDGMWLHEELQAMGLTVATTTLAFDYRVDDKELYTTIVLHTPGASLLRFERRERLPERANALVIDQMPSLTVSEHWEVIDEGFVQARNAFCMSKDGVDAETFLDRHVASVQRLLEAAGVEADTSTVAAYRRFARAGGRLRFGGEYREPLPIDELYERRGSGEVLTGMRARLEYDGRGVPMRWRQVDARPLPEWDDAPSMWAIVERERALRTVDDADAPDDDEVSLDVPGGEAPVPAAPAAAIVEPTAPPPAAATTSAPAVAAPTRSPADTPPVADVPPPAAPAGTPSAPAAQELTHEQRLAAARARLNQIGTGATTSVPRPRQAGTLGWDDLPAHAGQYLRVWTRHNPPRIVELIAIQGDKLRVQTRVGGGTAEFTIARENFQSASPVR